MDRPNDLVTKMRGVMGIDERSCQTCRWYVWPEIVRRGQWDTTYCSEPHWLSGDKQWEDYCNTTTMPQWEPKP
jgi:hypothetical protein